jgi:hypothetical protein
MVRACKRDRPYMIFDKNLLLMEGSIRRTVLYVKEVLAKEVELRVHFFL